MPVSTNSSAPADPHVWVTILAGGSGTRFWPASTPTRPKQLLPLAGDEPLIAGTLRRARALAADERIRILTGGHLLKPFRKILGEVNPSLFLVEPQPRGTGPVLVWAAWTILQEDPRATLVSLHADHFISPEAAFHGLLQAGAGLAASSDSLFTIAVPPDRPETGYGYIAPGDPINRSGLPRAFQVRAFREKPDPDQARAFLEAGYLWNSGIFIWQADAFLREVRAVAPELGNLIPLLEAGEVEEFFREAPLLSVDKAVLERSEKVACLKATFSWDDVGSWEALARTKEPDARGNILLGEVRAVDSKANIVMDQEGTTVLFGVEGLVVVRCGDVILVADRERSPDLKKLLEELPPHLRDLDPS